jgi:hypothetical protein
MAAFVVVFNLLFCCLLFLFTTAGVGVRAVLAFCQPWPRQVPSALWPSCLDSRPGPVDGARRDSPNKKPSTGGGASRLAGRLRALDDSKRSGPTPHPRGEWGVGLFTSYVLTPLSSFLCFLCACLVLICRPIFTSFFYALYAVGYVLSLVWRVTSVSWLFLQLGRVGFYFFFKNASSGGVPLWVYTSGATSTILAFPLFFFYSLPDKFTRYFFGLS